MIRRSLDQLGGAARSALVGAALLTTAACFTDLAAPPGSRISCTANADCPAGWICQNDLRRCFDVAGADGASPALTGVVIAPPVAIAGNTLTLSFDLAGAHARPKVSLGLTPPRAMQLDAAATNESTGRFVFTYLVVGDEAAPEQDLANVPVLVEVVSGVGVPASNTVGLVAFDFSPPALSGFVWTVDAPGKTAARTGDVLTLAGLTEATAVFEAARLVDENGLILEDCSAEMRLIITPGVRAEIEGEIDLSGVALTHGIGVAVEIDMTDALGNRLPLEAARSDFYPIDLVAPTNPSLLINDGDAETTTTAVRVSADADEAIGVRLFGDDVLAVFESDPAAPLTFPAEIDIFLTPAPTGGKTVSAELFDGAGNVSTTVTDTITLAPDVTAPEVLTFDTPGPAWRSDPTIAVTVVAQDNFAIDRYLIREGSGVPSSLDFSTLGSTTAPTSFVLPAGQGAHELYAWVRDVTGIVSSQFTPRTVQLDTVPPTVNSVVINNGAYTNSRSITVTATVSDPGGADGSGISGNRCIFSLTDSAPTAPFTLGSCGSGLELPDSDGSYTVYAWVVDVAGNLSVSDGGNLANRSDSILLDRVAPSMIFQTTSPSSTNNVAITASATDAGSGVDAWAMTTTSGSTCSAFTSGQFVLSSAPTQVTVSEGIVTVCAAVRDRAGNPTARQGSARYGQFQVDLGQIGYRPAACGSAGFAPLMVWEFQAMSSVDIALKGMGNAGELLAGGVIEGGSSPIDCDQPAISCRNVVNADQREALYAFRQGGRISARFVNSFGMLQTGAQMPLGTGTTQAEPTTCAFTAGGVVAWQEETPAIHFQRIDGTGLVGSVGRVDIGTFGAVNQPSLDCDRSNAVSAGAFLAAWEADNDGTGARRNVFYRVFDNAGQPLAAFASSSAGIFPGATAGGGDGAQTAPVVARGPSHWAVAWVAPDANSTGIYLRRFGNDGTPTGDAILVNGVTSGAQTNPSVAYDRNGRLGVAWQSSGEDGNGEGIAFKVYNTSMVAEAGAGIVNTTTTGDQTNPTITFSFDNALVLWESGNQIYGKYP